MIMFDRLLSDRELGWIATTPRTYVELATYPADSSVVFPTATPTVSATPTVTPTPRPSPTALPTVIPNQTLTVLPTLGTAVTTLSAQPVGWGILGVLALWLGLRMVLLVRRR